MTTKEESIKAAEQFLAEDLEIKVVMSRQKAHDLCKRFGVWYSPRGTGLETRYAVAARLVKELAI